MITCGRCGEPAGIGGFGGSFRIFERFTRDGQKMSICSDLCDKCQKELVVWLTEGGYTKNHGPELPVRSTVAEIVELRNKLNALIDKLDSKEQEEQK